MKKTILSFVITLFLSAVTTYLSLQFLEGYSIDPLPESSASKGQVIRLFIIWLIYFFALVSLPFLWKGLIGWIVLKEKDWWKVPLILELFAMVFAHLVTPPDFVTTFLFFMLCQPIVIVNSFLLKRKLTGIQS